jgi:hypothetical protein
MDLRGGHRVRLTGRSLATIAAAFVLACVAAALLSGFFVHLSTLGAHDWDAEESYRYVAVKSIRDFAQFPFWDPYGCGGFPSWGSPEGGTNVVSPFLPVYLAYPLATALRVEIATMVVLGVLGTWFFARRYVEHPLAIAFVCLVAALNSRFALQAAVGHAWHLYYAGMPWVLGAYDRALGDDDEGRGPVRLRWVAFGAVVFAWMVYGGGIYPVPHTALCLVFLGLYRARAFRSLRPLLVALVIPAWGSLLAAPKSLAVLETMSRFPRLTESHEGVDPISWVRIFVSSADSIPDHQIVGLNYLWHEYGQYIGLVPLALLVWGATRKLGRDLSTARLRALRFAGVAFALLAIGWWGPWAILHLFPIFKSQHVPTRFTIGAVLLLATVAAHALEEHVPAWRARAKLSGRTFDACVWALFVLSAALVAREDARCTGPWFSLEVPDVAEQDDAYFQLDDVPPAYLYGNGDSRSELGTNDVAGLLVRRANLGTIRCSAFPGLNSDAPRELDGRPALLGARGLGDPLYRGEFHVEPWGEASLVRWSPNEVVLAVHGAESGDVLVLNQNWAPGWTANGAPALNRDDLAAAVLAGGDETVTFRYRPRSLPASLLLLALGLLAGPVAWLALRARARPRRQTP